MRRAFASSVAMAAVLAAVPATQTRPPAAPVRPVTETLHGVTITDPYRWMEDGGQEFTDWLKAEDAYTRSVLDRIPGREKLLARAGQLNESVSQVDVERLPDNRYLLRKQLKLYVREGDGAKDRLLVDPEKITLAPAGRIKGRNAISSVAASPDGKYVAVGITPGGSETDTEIHVVETDSGRETGDVIIRAAVRLADPLATYSWLPDSHSFVYRRFNDPVRANPTEVRQKMPTYLHVLGRDPGSDPAVFGYDVVPTIHVDAGHLASVELFPGSRYAVGEIHRGVSGNEAVYIAPVSDFGKRTPTWRKLVDFSDGVGAAAGAPPSGVRAAAIAVHADDVYLLTYNNAPRCKVIRLDARAPDLASAETVVPPGEAVVTGIHAAHDALYVELMDAGISRLLRVPYGARPDVKEVTLPFKGTVTVQTDPRLPGAMLGMTSWTRARRVAVYDPEATRVIDTGLQPAGPFGNPETIESVEVKVPSHDGTMVPLSIVHPTNMKLDASNPTLLSGYGAYGLSLTPVFVPIQLAWIEHGGVKAVCHVRGGGEYGEQWHLAGQGATKPNSWLDFIACAQYLIDHKYTSPARLAAWGESAGGITVGRAIAIRPELFAVAIDQKGISDTVRLEATANGAVNVPEFGSANTEAGFSALYAMSPYDHIKEGTRYPAVLLMTAINDQRAVPWQMAKMAARLQAATASAKPVLLRVDWGSGHLGASDQQYPDMYSFVLWQMGVPEFQPRGESAP